MKDICRLLNVTRETLRHYEREGLIQLFKSGTKKDTHRYFEAYLPLDI
jgi:DNA-binding transcriptional MerR regulator